MIPKIIHYCWFGKGTMSELELDCIQSWKDVLPDYKIQRWDENNFDFEEFDFTKRAYRFRKFAFVADVCRLFALREMGGIYLDTDMKVLKDFTPLLDFPFFVGEEKEGVLSAGVIGSEKGNDIVMKLLNGYRNIEFDVSNPLYIPLYFTSCLDKSQIKIFPKEYFYPLPFKNRGQEFISFLTINSYAVHLWNYSWKDEWFYLHNKDFKKSLNYYIKSLNYKKIGNFNFLISFAKFFIADKFPYIYYVLKKNERG